MPRVFFKAVSTLVGARFMKQAIALINQVANIPSNLYDLPLSDTYETLKTFSFYRSIIAGNLVIYWEVKVELKTL